MGNIVSVDLSVQTNRRDKQGIALLSIVRLPLDMTISLPDSYVSLTHAMRQCVLCCELKGKLALLLSPGMDVGLGFEKQSNSRACRQMTRSIVIYVASKLMTVVRAKEAEVLCASGQFAFALFPMQYAIYLGDLKSRALKAWLLLEGREDVAEDYYGAFELVEEGARLGCHHCQGVMAWCYWSGYGCVRDDARSLELARESSGLGSRYGQYVLGLFYKYGEVGVAQDYVLAVALYRLAAAQNLDVALHSLGYMYVLGCGVARDLTEALRLFQLAAAQGHPGALYTVAHCHEYGRGVPENMAEAIRWYRRAQAAGNTDAALALQRLRA